MLLLHRLHLRLRRLELLAHPLQLLLGLRLRVLGQAARLRERRLGLERRLVLREALALRLLQLGLQALQRHRVRLLYMLHVRGVLRLQLGLHLLQRHPVAALQALHLRLQPAGHRLALLPRLGSHRIQLLLQLLAGLLGLLQVRPERGQLVLLRLGVALDVRRPLLRLGDFILGETQVLPQPGHLLLSHLGLPLGLLRRSLRLACAQLQARNCLLQLRNLGVVLLGLLGVLRLLFLGNAEELLLRVRELLLLGRQQPLQLRDPRCGLRCLSGCGLRLRLGR
mmetsp:Transcript_7372/g.19030  ORF Transcript_7372/g.19030 Transcript_7372/m.19030 type:complete len:281 (-) Transcript_7372:1056-1898(-)